MGDSRKRYGAPVEMLIDSLRRGLFRETWCIILKEKAKERYLPIDVSNNCADRIKSVLLGHEPSRSAQDAEAGFAIGSTRICEFSANSFWAKLSITNCGRLYEVRQPAGEAIERSVRHGRSVFVDEAVLELAGIDVT
jgi:hypothetical protein